MKKGNMGGLCVLFHEKCNLEKGGNKQKGIWVVWYLKQYKNNLYKGGNEQTANMGV